MIKHIFHITFRHFRKQVMISFLNVAGLVVGMTCFILIMLYVNHELQYDKYHENYDEIYRVAVDAKIGNTLIQCTWTPAPLPAAMYDEFPEIMAVTRILDRPQSIRIGDLLYDEEKAAAVDSSFTSIFTLHFVEGSKENVLNGPGQVILDQSTAKKYFGRGSAIGQVIRMRDTVPLTVVGVFEDFPVQSHFHFNILISLLSFDGFFNNPQWFANDFKTYAKLTPGFPPEELEAKLPSFVDKYMYKGTYEESTDDENYWTLYLQHISEIHLGSDLDGEFEPNGNLSYIRIFSVIAVLLLLVACINYMNLTTAKSSVRAREMGVRKTFGASLTHLRKQFFGEAILYSVLALILAIALVALLIDPYRTLTGREIQFQFQHNFVVIPCLIALPVIVGLLSGIYPAFFISKLSAINSLNYSGVRQYRSWFRNILVLVQFAVAIFLIAATMVVHKQMNLITEESLGFNKEQVVLVKNIAYLKNLEAYKDELRSRSRVIQVSVSSWVPGDKITNWSFGAEGVDKDFSLNVNLTDESYAETMGIDLVRGRYFSGEFISDYDKIVLNETAVELLEMEDPVGRITYLWANRSLPYEVIGVVKDYHWESKHMKIRPHALMLLSERFRDPYYLSVRFSGSDYQNIIQDLQNDWEKYVPEVPFDYEILGNHYDGIYKNEKKTRSLLIYFSIITILISCLGLFGLAAFMAERRTREIGIRKANGATTTHIVRLMTLDFTKWVVIANLIAWPLAWFTMRKWLENFVYRVDISLWVFGLAGMMALLIAFATVSIHAIRASKQNPWISLKYE